MPALSGGEVPVLGDTDLPHSCTNVADVAAALATLAERPEVDGRVWHLPTAPAVSTREIHRMIEERTGVPRRTVPLAGPRPFGPFHRQFMDEYAEMFHQHTEPQILDSSAFEDRFGLLPTPLARPWTPPSSGTAPS